MIGMICLLFIGAASVGNASCEEYGRYIKVDHRIMRLSAKYAVCIGTFSRKIKFKEIAVLRAESEPTIRAEYISIFVCHFDEIEKLSQRACVCVCLCIASVADVDRSPLGIDCILFFRLSCKCKLISGYSLQHAAIHPYFVLFHSFSFRFFFFNSSVPTSARSIVIKRTKPNDPFDDYISIFSLQPRFHAIILSLFYSV